MDAGFPHEKHEPREYGQSPGNGITPIALSRDPLATEGEATPGPDDYNPYDERELRDVQRAQLDDDPTGGDDPYAFDDVGDGGEFGIGDLPGFGDDAPGPVLEF